MTVMREGKAGGPGQSYCYFSRDSRNSWPTSLLPELRAVSAGKGSETAQGPVEVKQRGDFSIRAWSPAVCGCRPGLPNSFSGAIGNSSISGGCFQPSPYG